MAWSMFGVVVSLGMMLGGIEMIRSKWTEPTSSFYTFTSAALCSLGLTAFVLLLSMLGFAVGAATV
jgi:hypothetical protein